MSKRKKSLNFKVDLVRSFLRCVVFWCKFFMHLGEIMTVVDSFFYVALEKFTSVHYMW